MGLGVPSKAALRKLLEEQCCDLWSLTAGLAGPYPLLCAICLYTWFLVGTSSTLKDSRRSEVDGEGPWLGLEHEEWVL